jgi:hypothetical protein
MADMSRIERTIMINRPLTDVFDFVHDSSKDAMWQTTLVASEPLTPGLLRPGAQVREVRQVPRPERRADARTDGLFAADGLVVQDGFRSRPVHR